MLTPNTAAHAAHAIAVIKTPGTFWPTVSRAASTLAAIGGAVGSTLALLNRRRLQEVHVLVNGNMARSLSAVEAAAVELTKVSAERDRARADLSRIGVRAADQAVDGHLHKDLAAIDQFFVSHQNRRGTP